MFTYGAIDGAVKITRCPVFKVESIFAAGPYARFDALLSSKPAIGSCRCGLEAKGFFFLQFPQFSLQGSQQIFFPPRIARPSYQQPSRTRRSCDSTLTEPTCNAYYFCLDHPPSNVPHADSEPSWRHTLAILRATTFESLPRIDHGLGFHFGNDGPFSDYGSRGVPTAHNKLLQREARYTNRGHPSRHTRC